MPAAHPSAPSAFHDRLRLQIISQIKGRETLLRISLLLRTMAGHNSRYPAPRPSMRLLMQYPLFAVLMLLYVIHEKLHLMPFPVDSVNLILY